jgi:7-cyano-7-deazaguanine synthase
MKKSVCIISGGMDSATASKITQDLGYEIVAVHFNYHQRTQTRELEAFRAVSDALGAVGRYEIDLPFFGVIGASALTDENIEVPTGGLTDGVPITYVPFRNGIFLSIATAIAEKEGASIIVIGAVEEDSSGYPDCTEGFLDSFEQTANCGTKHDTSLKIFAPLLHLSKEDIVKKAHEIGVDLALTWSCYKNEEVACGVCDSCRLRLGGFAKAGLKDPIPYI